MSSLLPEDDHRLPREERLKKKKSIEELFAKGSSFSLYPFRVIFITKDTAHYQAAPPTSGLPKMMVSVSKRNFRKAHQRNLVKRRMRECYRRLRPFLSACQAESDATVAHVAFIYVARELYSYDSMYTKLKSSLERLATNGNRAKTNPEQLK